MIEEDEPWWDEEDDEWSDEAYYVALAEYFNQQYQNLLRRFNLVDCE